VVGDKWPVELDQLKELKKHADEKELLTKLQKVKHVRYILTYIKYSSVRYVVSTE